MLTGRCLCQQVQYVYAGTIDTIVFCHCADCRRAQGTPFASSAPIARAQFTFTQGAHLVRYYESSPGKKRHFCGHCGSPLYSELHTLPDTIRLRLGTLDQDLHQTAPNYHIFTSDKADWYAIQDDKPQFATWPTSS